MNVLMIGPSRKIKGGVSTVVNTYYNSDLVHEVKLKYIATMAGTNKILKAICAMAAYMRILLSLIFLKIDIVHVHMASRASFYRKRIAIKICRLFNKKYIIHLHGGEFHIFYDIESSENQKQIIKKVFDEASAIIVVSDEWKGRIKKITDNNKIHVIYNSVQTHETNKYNTKSRNILFMGRMVKGKGIYDILDIVKDVCEVFPNYKFVLCGSGEFSNVKDIVGNKGLAEHVVLNEWVTGDVKNKILEDAALFLLPSYNECMPMSILEAMSYGIPVLATKVGGIPDIIADKKNGVLIDAGNTAALKREIIDLLGKEEQRMEISINAYKTIHEKFDILNNVNSVINLYKSVINYDFPRGAKA